MKGIYKPGKFVDSGPSIQIFKPENAITALSILEAFNGYQIQTFIIFKSSNLNNLSFT